MFQPASPSFTSPFLCALRARINQLRNGVKFIVKKEQTLCTVCLECGQCEWQAIAHTFGVRKRHITKN